MKWKVLWFIVFCAHASQAMEPEVYDITDVQFNEVPCMKELMKKCYENPAHIVRITVDAQNPFFQKNMGLSIAQFLYGFKDCDGKERFTKVNRLIIADPDGHIESTDYFFLRRAECIEVELSFPKLKNIGEIFMNDCTKLKKLKLFFPNLQSMAADFFKGSKVRAIEVLPQTVEIFKNNLGDRVESIEEKDGSAYIYLK